MSVTITIDNAESLAKALNDLSTTAASNALAKTTNRLGFKAREKWRDEGAAQVFDRPTSITRRALLVRQAKPGSQSARIFAGGASASGFTEVFVRDEAAGTAPDKYLTPQSIGGSRQLKGFERRLIARGRMLPGQFAVPAASAKLDAFGNMSRGQLNQILSALDAQRDRLTNETARSRARKKRRGKSQYFAVPTPRNGLHPGVYERRSFALGSAIRPVLIFVDNVTFKPRLNLAKFVSDVIRSNGEQTLLEEVTREIDRATRNANR